MLKFKEQSQTNTADLINLKDGQAIEGIFQGEIHEFKKAFNEGDKPKFRFRINIVIKEDNVLQSKILEGGWKLYNQLRELTHSGWDLHTCKIKISRTGAKMNDTVYTATVLPTPVPAKVLEVVASVPLKVLDESKVQAVAPALREPGDDEDFDHAPF